MTMANTNSSDFITLPNKATISNETLSISTTFDKKSLKSGKKGKIAIFTGKKYEIHLIDENDFESQKATNMKYWKHIQTIDNGFFYVKPLFNKDIGGYDSTIVRQKDKDGNPMYEHKMEVGFRKFRKSYLSNKCIGLSDDMVLFAGDIDNPKMTKSNIQGKVEDIYHVKCVDISKNGEFTLYTHANELRIMDANLRGISNIDMPFSDESIVQFKQTSGRKQYFDCLGISADNPSEEEIKQAYRKALKSTHPDVNREDPHALEKTRKIIEAYQSLTGDDPKNIFDEEFGQENFFYKTIVQFELEVEGHSVTAGIGFGMSGIGEDWIYSTYISPLTDIIYVGCYSGRVYCMTKNAALSRMYDAHNTIEQITENKESLYIKTDRLLYIIKNKDFINSIDITDAGYFRPGDRILMLIATKVIKLYTVHGDQIGMIQFKDSIEDAFETTTGIKVVTRKKNYYFKIIDL